MAEKTRDLDNYWNEGRGDNFATATDVGRESAEAAQYSWVRTEGRVWDRQIPGSEPLTLFWSAARQDNFSTPPSGDAAAASAGYERVRVEGFVRTAPPESGPFSRFRSWWNADRGDNFLTGALIGDREAVASKYTLVSLARCYGPPARAIDVTQQSRSERFQTGVFLAFDGTGFTPNGVVRTTALSFAKGLPNPEVQLGSAKADGAGRVHDLVMDTTHANLPQVDWIGVVTDIESNSELFVGSIF